MFYFNLIVVCFFSKVKLVVALPSRDEKKEKRGFTVSNYDIMIDDIHNVITYCSVYYSYNTEES